MPNNNRRTLSDHLIDRFPTLKLVQQTEAKGGFDAPPEIPVSYGLRASISKLYNLNNVDVIIARIVSPNHYSKILSLSSPLQIPLHHIISQCDLLPRKLPRTFMGVD